jgi:integrase
MAKQIEKLDANKIKRLKQPGYYGDGGGLWLRIGPTGAKSWVFRYRVGGGNGVVGRQREMGLGSCDTFNLFEARERARAMRQERDAGVDPIEKRRAERTALIVATAKAMTFRQCAEAFIESHEAGWRNAKHAAQWSATLATYVYPHFGALPVAAVDVGLVMKAVQPIWKTKPETAGRVRGRIESILDWAKTAGYREGENPARWRGHLEHMLPKRAKVQKVEHHAALPYREVGEFMAALREQAGVAARALEFAILTASRTGEVLGARWSEFNLTERVWIVPASRMKAGKEHRVPLSDAALAVLGPAPRGAPRAASDGFVFPGARPGSPLSNMALLMTLRRMGRGDLTAHGFRSTFSDWCAERTAFPAEVREMALAHSVGDKVEAAYRRGDMFEKRRQLAEAWADFCARTEMAAEVTPIRAQRGGS